NAATAELQQLLLVEDLDREPRVRGDGLGDLGHLPRGQQRPRSVRQVARELHGAGRRLRAPKAVLDLVDGRRGPDDRERFERLLVLWMSEGTVAIARQNGALRDGLRSRIETENARRVREQHGDPRVSPARARERGGGIAQHGGIDLRSLSDADGDPGGTARPRDDHGLADLSFETGGSQRRTVEPESRRDLAVLRHGHTDAAHVVRDPLGGAEGRQRALHSRRGGLVASLSARVIARQRHAWISSARVHAPKLQAMCRNGYSGARASRSLEHGATAPSRVNASGCPSTTKSRVWS